MSLAGIAISIGVLVDGAIVEVENAYNKLHLWEAGGRKGDFHEVRLEALKEVGPSVFFSLLVIAVAFLPIFALVDQEGRLFKPLAYSKNLAMAIAARAGDHARPGDADAVHAHGPVPLPPAVAGRRCRRRSSSASTRRRSATRSAGPSASVYDPACRLVLRFPKTVIALAVARGGCQPAGLLAASAPSSCRR